ncbi:MAG TPA: hypothetical protein PLH98_08195 [Ruminococcus flavefaciens]|nr:hypothetical protein [Ruminococcus flavefaciens]HQM00523.1 hypothetical protein [Ruminococcus flavefaciens]
MSEKNMEKAGVVKADELDEMINETTGGASTAHTVGIHTTYLISKGLQNCPLKPTTIIPILPRK